VLVSLLRPPRCTDAHRNHLRPSLRSRFLSSQKQLELSVLSFRRLLGFADTCHYAQPVIDTHCHLLPTFTSYRLAYPDGSYTTLSEFVSELYTGVETVIDVWCDVVKGRIGDQYREVAESAESWSNLDYRFVIGLSCSSPSHPRLLICRLQGCIREISPYLCTRCAISG
jgi:hypothetical protein